MNREVRRKVVPKAMAESLTTTGRLSGKTLLEVLSVSKILLVAPLFQCYVRHLYVDQPTKIFTW